MNPDAIRRYFPNASASVLAANAEGAGETAKLERDSRNEPLEARKAKKGGSSRLHISFVSVRKRLCDPDNISEKWLLDCLRYCGAIPGDEPEKITLETTQRKAARGEAEHTEITVYDP